MVELFARLSHLDEAVTAIESALSIVRHRTKLLACDFDQIVPSAFHSMPIVVGTPSAILDAFRDEMRIIEAELSRPSAA